MTALPQARRCTSATINDKFALRAKTRRIEAQKQQHTSTRSRNTPRTGEQKRCCVVFEFSCSPSQHAGFRSEMAERVSRLFDASRSKPEVTNVRTVTQSCVPQSCVLESCVLQSCVLLRPVSVRRVPAHVSQTFDQTLDMSLVQTLPPRSFASCSEGPGSVLRKMMPKLKRAASARLFQRLSARLAPLKHRPSVLLPSSLRPSSLRPRPVHQCPVALRFH